MTDEMMDEVKVKILRPIMAAMKKKATPSKAVFMQAL